MGGYDLYGNYYSNTRDAENAEMAQCASIDADRNSRELQEMQDDRQSLEQRIIELEQTVAYLLGVNRNGRLSDGD